MLQHPYASVTTGKLSCVSYKGRGTEFPAEKIREMRERDFQSRSGANILIGLRTNFRAGTRVVYWGANPQLRHEYSEKLTPERRAFHGFQNFGVATVASDGWITCRVATPRPYLSMNGDRIGRHIYLRRASYRNPQELTGTLYAASALPTAPTPCRTVKPIRGSNHTVLSVFLSEGMDAPFSAAQASSVRELARLARNGEMNLFVVS